MKKFVIPSILVLIVLVQFLTRSDVFDAVYAAYGGQTGEAFVRASLYTSLIGMIIPIYLGVAWIAIYPSQPWLKLVPILMVLISLLDWLYVKLLYTSTSTVNGTLVTVFSLLIMLCLLAVWIYILWLETDKRVKDAMWMYVGFLGLYTVVNNIISHNWIVDIARRQNRFETATLILLLLGHLGMLLLANIVLEQYRGLETSTPTVPKEE